MIPDAPGGVQAGLAEHHYLADVGLSTAIFLAMRLARPLLLEGEAGVGKTEVAKTLARWTGGELIRLQCYEGIDVSQAIYEWDYTRQLLHLRAAELRSDSEAAAQAEDELFSERFLIRRPLLRAISPVSAAGPMGLTDEPPPPAPPVLLVDEIDRADDEFEAYLLEALSEYAITIPELGTFRAERPPLVIITSNRTREVHDALKRRCLYHWVEHPDFEREVEIVRLRAPEAGEVLGRSVAAAVQSLRTMQLYKPPGVAETIDWAQALATLGCERLDRDAVLLTIGSVLKYREDAQRVVTGGIDQLIDAVGSRSG